MAEFDDIEDLVIPHDVLRYRDKSFKLRGLTAAQITWIVRNHGTALAPLYHEATAGRLPADMAAIAVQLENDFTLIASHVIAAGMGKTDAPAAIAKAASLPFAVQIDALDKIVRLTMDVEGGLGNVVEIIIRGLKAIKPHLPQKT